jgi:hypothetical protein
MCAEVIGAYGTMSCCRTGNLSSSESAPASTRCRIAAASSHLNVEHIAKRSCALNASSSRDCVSSMYAPTRPPMRAWIAATACANSRCADAARLAHELVANETAKAASRERLETCNLFTATVFSPSFYRLFGRLW